MRLQHNIIKLSLVIFAILISSFGCERYPTSEKKDVIAYVNKDPIYKSDLKRDIALRAKLDPTFKITPETEEDQLDAIIDRKLIVQYAMEKGLAREERFVNTIRTIWEHTLIRDFIDYKKKELQDYLFATDEDIRKFYGDMSEKATFKVFKTRDRRTLEGAYKRYLKDKETSGWQTIGPLRYEDISSSELLDAFEMNKGEARKFDDEPNYYIIELADKEKVELAPFETLKPEIEKRVIAMKERRLFEEWLKERKKRSSIRVIK